MCRLFHLVFFAKNIHEMTVGKTFLDVQTIQTVPKYDCMLYDVTYAF